ncbi:PhoH family protein [Paracoccus litorisediminis]|uniref:PhoH family protein n=1 Tax=Paracoccus litorisediminis TaxID=2006130 RepID=UPI00373574CC
MNATVDFAGKTGARLETLVEFPDNRLTIQLCGIHDRHLGHLEKNLGVQILKTGNHFSIFGDQSGREGAATILRALYGRLEGGNPIGIPEIDMAMRMGVETLVVPPILKRASRKPGATPPAPVGNICAEGGLVTRKKAVEARTEAQKAYVASLLANELNFGIGPAGTGKTYLAVAAAVTMLINGDVEKIILSRPAVEAGERLGFLPGDMKEKVDPYMQPLYDALNDFLPPKQLQKLMEEKRIEIAPLAFMRGRTLANAFVLLDEAQNATTLQMKMFLTRLGEGSRMAITGDRTQIDLPRGVQSGLADAERILMNVAGIGFSYFTSKDVVRHPMVARIIEAYQASEENSGK